MNSLTVKIIAALLGVLMVTMLGSQLYYFVNEKHDTEEAVLSTINENISFDGVVVRNETVINYSGSGVIDYLFEDGSKVKADDAVAEVYASEDQILDLDWSLGNYRRNSDPRYYKGVEYVDVLEELARRRCAELSSMMLLQSLKVIITAEYLRLQTSAISKRLLRQV